MHRSGGMSPTLQLGQSADSGERAKYSDLYFNCYPRLSLGTGDGEFFH